MPPPAVPVFDKVMSARSIFSGRVWLLLFGAVLTACGVGGPVGEGKEEGETMREAMFYRARPDGAVECDLCFRECLIPEGERGFCRVRENRDGRLYSLVYGRPAGLQVDPIEMEPAYHLRPGHRNLCVYTASCNFRCRHCQNWHLSQRSPEEVSPRPLSPREVVAEARRRNCLSISHSINEPTVFFEYMLDIAREARAAGLINLFHTNGAINPEPLRLLLAEMDAAVVDLKGFSEEFYREVAGSELAPVLRTLEEIRKTDVHLEVVCLIIPTLNDDPGEIEEMSRWIAEKLGPETPVHFNRFSPSYRLRDLPPTPVATLEKARETALAAGLKYVYIGNVPGHPAASTYCPGCSARLIRRTHAAVLENRLEEGTCPGCGYTITGIW